MAVSFTKAEFTIDNGGKVTKRDAILQVAFKGDLNGQGTLSFGKAQTNKRPGSGKYGLYWRTSTHINAFVGTLEEIKKALEKYGKSKTPIEASTDVKRKDENGKEQVIGKRTIRIADGKLTISWIPSDKEAMKTKISALVSDIVESFSEMKEYETYEALDNAIDKFRKNKNNTKATKGGLLDLL